MPKFEYSRGSILGKGVRVHNLKNVDFEIPHLQLSVITGPSGSGKSSLAFDTLYAEGQRKYLESLSSYARTFIEKLSKPDLDELVGVTPTISLNQKTVFHGTRSTVGTVTGISDFLRVLFAKASTARCWKCQQTMGLTDSESIFHFLNEFPEKSKVHILAPLIQQRKGEYKKELEALRKQGFTHIRLNQEILDLLDPIEVDRHKRNSIDVVIDRILLKKTSGVEYRSRVETSVASALRISKTITLLVSPPGSNSPDAIEKIFSNSLFCDRCNISYPEPEPRLFSFNSSFGACAACEGKGVLAVEEEGDASENCPTCLGKRLSKESLSFFVNGFNLYQLGELSIPRLREFLDKLPDLFRPDPLKTQIVGPIVSDLTKRLLLLEEIGLSYLNLNRSFATLSGGESQRVRITSQISLSLIDVTYIFDEPSIGLHPSDNSKLIGSLKNLKDMGNTVVVVEHDRETIKNADWIIDVGPRAGNEGGTIVYQGHANGLLTCSKSLTAQYLSGNRQVYRPPTRRNTTTVPSVRMEGLTKNNIQNLTFEFPLNNLVCMVGVSGSGKSTLICDTAFPILHKAINLREKVSKEIRLSGIDQVDRVEIIDQRPIGRTPRSAPATFVGIFDEIRTLFASLPAASQRAYTKGRFSFNVKGGRCETCEGDGFQTIELFLLPNVLVPCPTCKEQRYNSETLQVRYKGKSISDILKMTVSEALPFFTAFPKIASPLTLMEEVGLGYLQLGQSATTLSGGEAQRLKLCKELSLSTRRRTLYILDEPSTGLHFEDISNLLRLLHRLVDRGHSILVVEHCMEIIESADYLIELGPTGGEGGGKIIARGTPEELARAKNSKTGPYLFQ